ncbi:MAG TPA: glycosyltransferase family 4 protein [Bryobacteraceae bacterium]|nr:glycosyltransferase family 4 protein [Bryobacteraceae bacterium]
MLKAEVTTVVPANARPIPQQCRVAVIWIDWYAYHLARFQGLLNNVDLAGRVAGIEMVGGVGVHAGLKFREEIPAAMPVETLFPAANWREAKGFRLAMTLWKRLDRLSPEVVLVPGYYTLAGVAAALWAKAKRRRTVLMTESTGHDHQRVWWKEAFKSALIRGLFDWAVAGGAPHRRYLERLGFPAGRIARFYDVVDNDFFRERSQALRNCYTSKDFDLPERYFLYVGRLAEEKNVAGLLNAYLQYRKYGGDWSLVFVGDGPQHQELRATADASRFASDIHFEGLRGTPDLPQYYAFAGCFVLPSTREPWGLVANEAMACGLPVILSQRCGCMEDLLRERENGFSFDPSQLNDLAARLSGMSRLSPEARTAMGHRSLEIIARFSPEAWASEIAMIAGAPAR